LFRHVPVPRGAPQRPLETAQLVRKDEALAVPVIGQRQFDALQKAIRTLEMLADFRQIAALLTPA
jgi:hypothetical protein